MSKITNVVGREILDSRGNPTVEVEVVTELGSHGVFSVPSGASTGSKEALELRDNDDSRYNGKGVLKAVQNVNTLIKEALIGEEVENQKSIDKILIELDGTENKTKLGANATIGVSIACLKSAALDNKEELYNYLNKREKKIPCAMFNILNGGVHADNNLCIQEFMIVPKFQSFKEVLRCASEVFNSLRTLLKENNFNTNVGDEGGFAPNLTSNKQALDLIVKAIENAKYIPGKNVFIALDAAATSFYNKEGNFYFVDKQKMTTDDLLNFYSVIVKEYPIISIEDPFHENDIDGFKKITQLLGKGLNIVGDDLFVTNKKYLEMGIKEKLCNSILIKPNQIGTFFEMLETIVLAKQSGYTCILSHRSGETVDTFIAQAAVALNIPLIKSGSISRGERICKYNELMRIEDELNKTLEK